MSAVIQHALGDHALPFAEQIRQYASVTHLNNAARVIQFKAHIKGVLIADHATRLDVAPDTQTLTHVRFRQGLGFAVDNLSRRIEEIDVRTEGIKRQADG